MTEFEKRLKLNCKRINALKKSLKSKKKRARRKRFKEEHNLAYTSAKLLKKVFSI